MSSLHRFANPANYDTDALPPGLENWDPTEYFTTALPIFLAVLATNLSHEIGHRLAVRACVAVLTAIAELYVQRKDLEGSVS